MQIVRKENSIALENNILVPHEYFEVGDKKIDWQGEYQIKGVSIRIIEGEEGRSFLMGSEDLRIFCPGTSLPKERELLCDVLLISGKDNINTPREWKNFVEDEEPRVLIFLDMDEKTEAIRKELGVADPENEEKITLVKKNLPQEKSVSYRLG